MNCNKPSEQVNKLHSKHGFKSSLSQTHINGTSLEMALSKMFVETMHSPTNIQEIPGAPTRRDDSIGEESSKKFHIFFTQLMLAGTRSSVTSKGRYSDSEDQDSDFDSDVDSIVVERRRRARKTESSQVKDVGNDNIVDELGGRTSGWEDKQRSAHICRELHDDWPFLAAVTTRNTLIHKS